MNFFAYQDQARSNTRKLVFLFCCAVLTLIIITSFLVVAVLFYVENQGQVGLKGEFLTSSIFLEVSVVVIAVVALGSLYRMSQLRGGGKSVAEAMGGRLLNTGSRDADERKILNVVEEMAIASGMPVPPVYLMEDESINAFAAGYRPGDAVIGITRGCIRELNRDELQGVIAHEFSHIFNGDMRLNIRLIGLLYGIMVIGLIGYHILRGSRYRTRSRSGKGGGGIILLGVGFLVIGYGGTFFGNLIKAAVSRQREFLADASAVQFTRNREGIGGALKKIGGYAQGTEIRSKDASEISHMLFCDGIAHRLSGLFATHPPLDERIRRIDPSWKGQGAYRPSSPKDMSSQTGVSHLAGAGTLVDSVGNPSAAHIEQASVTLSNIPGKLRDEVHHSMSASLVIYSLLLAGSPAHVLERQLVILREALDENNFRLLGNIQGQVAELPRDKYLAMIDLALPSLKQLSRIQYRQFMTVLGKLIMVDEEISLFEWCLFKILRFTLDEHPGRRQQAVPITSLAKECEVLISVLASAGHRDESSAREAFNRTRNVLDLGPMTYRHKIGVNTGALEQALDALNHLKPLQKPQLLKAMVTCINVDGRVTAEESELLRAVGSLLDCPIPPLLPGQNYL